jgi:hypothetical protein
MTILVFTPTIDDQLRPETGASIAAQKTDMPFVWEVSDHNPYPGEKAMNVVAQYQRGREMALAGGFDAMLTVEHDMVIPPDAIEKLYGTDAPVVYGVYTLRHGMKVLNTWQYQGDKNLGMSLSLYPAELRAYRKQGWGQVSGVGWGCTLIRREVLERLPVRRGDGDAGDLAFATDCLHLGIRMIARFDVPCDHIEPDGNILRPYEHGGTVSRVLALQDVVAPSGNGSLPMKKGRYYSLPDHIADELRRGGYVKITNGEDTQEEPGEVEQPDITAREMAVDPKAATRGKRQVPRPS